MVSPLPLIVATAIDTGTDRTCPSPLSSIAPLKTCRRSINQPFQRRRSQPTCAVSQETQPPSPRAQPVPRARALQNQSPARALVVAALPSLLHRCKPEKRPDR
ncbi:hypothetical protein M0R45_030120 [Rubus argutus]|uniref:Uncharacterized protein n=1 Tax=Rubus argutus TaxID=59490 RepID=A0AAW1WAC1_RUBAR